MKNDSLEKRVLAPERSLARKTLRSLQCLRRILRDARILFLCKMHEDTDGNEKPTAVHVSRFFQEKSRHRKIILIFLKYNKLLRIYFRSFFRWELYTPVSHIIISNYSILVNNFLLSTISKPSFNKNNFYLFQKIYILKFKYINNNQII